MADHTAIELTDVSWNLVTGCTKVMVHPERVLQPTRWMRPRRIFVNSMSDFFHEDVSDDWLAVLLGVMVFAPRHTYQILTKRPKRMQRWLAHLEKNESKIDFLFDAMKRLDVLDFKLRDLPLNSWPYRHIWWGVSVENQEQADKRIPLLLQTPAAVRFLSVEPLLGPVKLWPWFQCEPKISWVIVGGESGGPPGRALLTRCNSSDPHSCHDAIGGDGRRHYHAKPEALQWVRSLRDQCAAAGVPFFFKQWGGPTPKSGGRLLDGREWNEYPR